jgi:hypothetical protein
MRGIDIAFQRLQPVALPLPAIKAGIFRRTEHRFQGRQGRRRLALAHINVDEAAAFGDAISTCLHLLAEILIGRDVRHLQAVAVGVELPAVVDAAQATLLVAAEEQRRTAVRAAMVEDADAPGGIAERNQRLAQQHQPQRIAVGGQLARQTRRDPILPHQITHRGAGADTGQQLVFRLRGHRAISIAMRWASLSVVIVLSDRSFALMLIVAACEHPVSHRRGSARPYAWFRGACRRLVAA